MCQVLDEYSQSENFYLIDCFTSGKGKDDVVFQSFYTKPHGNLKWRVRKVDRPGEPEAFLHEMNRIEDECGEGPRYVFDSITGMQDLWGDETRAYKFFTYACPRLYDLKTIAYWILENEAHTRAFCANLRHVTQVAIGLRRARELNSLQILKADGRSLGPMHFDQQYEVIDNEVRFVDAARKQLDRVGQRMRFARQAKRMSQAEVARLLGLTGSTISQAENGLISLSLQHVVNLAHVLDVSPAVFFEEAGRPAHGTPVFRKGNRIEVFPQTAPMPGISIMALHPEEPDTPLSAYEVTFAPGQKLGEHFFATKMPEFGIVLSGCLQLHVGKAPYELSEGDSVFLQEDAPTGWKNLSDKESVILWVCSR